MIEESMAFVRGFPGEGLRFRWDYSLESPRTDLRGFRLENLAYDPVDARFDSGRPMRPSEEVRSDIVLAGGGRYYNDHGHPEYATPECESLRELMLHDLAGQRLLASEAVRHAEEHGRPTRVFKNNTDFSGASYGTHESYLVPRRLGFEGLFETVMPVLIARTLLCGAGKAGAESGEPCPFQMCQRADFMVEPANAETLYRRPIFNTRDEPHADPREWMRLHVISGDANLHPWATRRKAGLVKLAVAVCAAGVAPKWSLRDPVRDFKRLSRGLDEDVPLELTTGGAVTADQILVKLIQAAGELDLPEELQEVAEECERLLAARHRNPEAFAWDVEWAAKRSLLDELRRAEGLDWSEPIFQSLDLEWCDVDPEVGLWAAAVAEGRLRPGPSLGDQEVLDRADRVFEPSRAAVRSLAVRRFSDQIEAISWSSIRFRQGEVHLPPRMRIPEGLEDVETVEGFLQALSHQEP
ncbi:MAG: proteasome accessory factor PafA2 family protein [Fimbriimonadaceae bacterium]|nr:proteasome accessory factor PafA2 family protein [Fimbriimonadaceae bacterium]